MVRKVTYSAAASWTTESSSSCHQHLAQASLSVALLVEGSHEESVYAQGLSEVLTDFSEPPAVLRRPSSVGWSLKPRLSFTSRSLDRSVTRALLRSCGSFKYYALIRGPVSTRTKPFETEDNERAATRAYVIPSFLPILHSSWRITKNKSTLQMVTTMKT